MPYDRWRVTEVAQLTGDRLLMLEGELDIATAPALALLLDRLRRRGHSVVLDLAGITFIDSSGLGLLMDALVESQRDGWEFSIRRPSQAVRRVVALAGVEQLLGA